MQLPARQPNDLDAFLSAFEGDIDTPGAGSELFDREKAVYRPSRPIAAETAGRAGSKG